MPASKHRIFSGVLLLTASNLFVKVIGLFFKIPLQSVLGDEGMGYFNAAYSIYLWFYTLSTAGLPVAVSLLVAKWNAREEKQTLHRLYQTTQRLLFSLGLILCALMLLGAPLLARLIGAPSSFYAIAVIAPTVFFVCLSGGIRGYFQGLGNMLPTALSQVIEAVLKLALGIGAGVFALRRGFSLPVVSACAVSGLTIGSALGTLFLLLYAKWKREKPETVSAHALLPSRRSLLSDLFRIALPITLSSSVMSLTGLLDVGVVMRRLRAIGYAEGAAVALYGNYTTLAVPLFHLPPTLVTPIACAIVPPLTEAYEKGDFARQRTLRHTVLRIATVLLFPCAVGLSVFSFPILSLFFARPSVQLAAPLLSVLALAVPFVGLLSVTNSLLQVYGMEKRPIFSMLCGASVKLLCGIFLIGIPTIGIYGAPIGTLLCYAVACFLNFIFVGRQIGSFAPFWEWLVAPFLSSLGCASVASLVRYGAVFFLPASLATLLALFCAVLSYFLFLFLLGGLSFAELKEVSRLRRRPPAVKPIDSVVKERMSKSHESNRENQRGAQTPNTL